MGIVVTFPLEGTKIALWFNHALNLAQQQNINVAKQYIWGHVPQQLQPVIIRNLTAKLKTQEKSI